MIIPATGILLVFKIFLTAYKHLYSSFLLVSTFLSSGYFSYGKGATGQLKAGISILCITLDLVADNVPNFFYFFLLFIIITILI